MGTGLLIEKVESLPFSFFFFLRKKPQVIYEVASTSHAERSRQFRVGIPEDQTSQGTVDPAYSARYQYRIPRPTYTRALAVYLLMKQIKE